MGDQVLSQVLETIMLTRFELIHHFIFIILIAGTWAIECLNMKHLEAGMMAKYQILTCNKKGHNRPQLSPDGATSPPRGRRHTVYIAAVETEWNYAPGDYNIISLDRLPLSDINR